MFCVSLYFAFMSVVKYGKMRLLDWRLDFMMKMLIELDENKILQDGKYSLSKMNSYILDISQVFGHNLRDNLIG